MQADYSWGLNFNPNAPNNTATVRFDRDGTRWFEEINIGNVEVSDTVELLNFVKSLTYEKV